jgi:ribulose 1,5-bisphosphate synthetase/thiazole synthase
MNSVLLFILVIFCLVYHFAVVLPRLKKARSIDDKVIEENEGKGFTSKKISELQKYFDAIIIGSGIGSLTVGSLLARRGYKVCILEQHDKLGGCCHVFEEKGILYHRHIVLAFERMKIFFGYMD